MPTLRRQVVPSMWYGGYACLIEASVAAHPSDCAFSDAGGSLDWNAAFRDIRVIQCPTAFRDIRVIQCPAAFCDNGVMFFSLVF